RRSPDDRHERDAWGRPLPLEGQGVGGIGVKKNQADAFVFFGATGDLAYKKIFPALQRLVKRGKLDVPVVGVARSGWKREQLVERAKQSISEHGSLDGEAFEKLASLLRYVDGDYNDFSTYERLKTELGNCGAPIHYLAIPPSTLAPEVEKLAKASC